MGRRSVLTPEQWAEIERRHLIEDEAIRPLAREFGIDEKAVRMRINPRRSAKSAERTKNAPAPIKELAAQKLQNEIEARTLTEQICALPFPQQRVFGDLMVALRNTSLSLGSAAELHADTSNRLAVMANAEMRRVDPAQPLASNVDAIKGVIALTEASNKAATVPLNLLAANKESVQRANAERVIDADDDARANSIAERLESSAGGGEGEEPKG